ncbi:MAG: Transposase DDE domain protein [Pelotomaculum sp. PtaB.Bin104]|nr:MAG: Transposase DDE domain protein [Pelotomaculum sp. PtaB.Bin104]
MLWGLETGGYRLCYYRKVIVQVNSTPIASKALVNRTEFMLEDQIVTVTCKTDKFSDVTPHGFLSLFVLFLQELKFFNLFTLLDAPEKEVLYSTSQKIQTIIASIAVGCTYNSDINHQLVPYPVEAELLGIKRFPDQSQINRFLRHMNSVSLSQLDTIFSLSAHYFSLTSMLQDKVDIDIDSTGLIANGHTYQLNRKGYFSKRRGEKGYQLSMCIAGLTGDVLVQSFMPGNHSAPSDFIDLIYGAAEILGSFDRLGIVRADAGYGIAANLDFLIEHDLQFVVKGRNPRSFSDMVPYIPPTDWEYVNSSISIYDAGEKFIPKSSSDHRARIIMIKHITTKGKVEYGHLYTNLTMEALDILEYYNSRQCIEAIIRTDKSYLNIKNLRTRDFYGISAFLYLAFMTHNMLNLFRKAILEPMGITEIGLRNIVRKLMHVPAKVVKEMPCISLSFPDKHFYTLEMVSQTVNISV